MDEKRAANLLGAFVYASYGAVSARVTEKCGLGGEAPGALVLIGSNPASSEKFISIALGLSHSGTVRLIDKFEKDQLIERRRALDKRTVALHLTAKGARRARMILATREQVLREVLGALDESDKERLVDLLESMLAKATTSDVIAEHICRLCDDSCCPQDQCPVTLAAGALTEATGSPRSASMDGVGSTA